MNGYDRYEDILNAPHHRSPRHAPMSRRDRAAQFSPFAALNGHGDAIEETARLTDTEKLLDESRVAELDEALREIAAHLPCEGVTVVWFRPDERKQGGRYETATGCVRRVDGQQGVLRFTDGREIPISSVTEVSWERG